MTNKILEQIYYVAAPYSSKEPGVTEQRMDTFYKMDAIFIAHKMITLSPLSKHPTVIQSKLPGNWDFWQDYSERILFSCTHMIILALPGWEESTGVAGEIKFAEENMIPYTILSEGDIRSGKFYQMLKDNIK